MAVLLQDPSRTHDPSSRHAFPEVKADATLRAPRTLAEELLAGYRDAQAAPWTSFELESHGGYARTVSGTVVYLDEEAQTFMVRSDDGQLMRVPLRDITSAHGRTVNEPDERRSGRDLQGLGTGPGRS